MSWAPSSVLRPCEVLNRKSKKARAPEHPSPFDVFWELPHANSVAKVESLPLPEFGMGIPFDVHVVLEYPRDGVEARELGSCGGEIYGAPIADRARL